MGLCKVSFLAVAMGADNTCVVTTGGMCNFQDCYAWRGPTYCSKSDDFACICKPGYCVSGGTSVVNEIKREGVCIRDPTLAKDCDIDQSDTSCVVGIMECAGENQECSGSVYGVCQCKKGFCKNSEGVCAEEAAIVALSERFDLRGSPAVALPSRPSSNV